MTDFPSSHTLNSTIASVTEQIRHRSAKGLTAYHQRLDDRILAMENSPRRSHLGCANVAHCAAAAGSDQNAIGLGRAANLAIVTAYNDMLSAHQPYQTYPDAIRSLAREYGVTAQVAGGVPAMCDGITQGFDGMELSLFSRDVIAMATAVALSHETFDGVFYLGICDKIVPGLMIGALTFGQLPGAFVPSGPMISGLSNDEKRKARAAYQEGLIGREELLKAEMASYHREGTCTFYGTANTNQMVVELMGLQAPGSSFVNPGTPLRHALTDYTVSRVAASSDPQGQRLCLGRMVSVETFVNAIVGLCATGGSTNLVIHLTAMARAAGISLTLQDFANISAVTPLLARVYPNGLADINTFQAAGGMAFLVGELSRHGLLHDTPSLFGNGIAAYTREPLLRNGQLTWRDGPVVSGHPGVLRGIDDPFDHSGGLMVLDGNMGRAIIKTSAISPEHRRVCAPALIFHDQASVTEAFEHGRLNRDVVVVVRHQGPRANGMPELHKLTTPLSILQARGYKVALVTDGRMSGASGKIPAALHLSPEAANGGRIQLLADEDVITLDANAGTLHAAIDEETWHLRTSPHPQQQSDTQTFFGSGRELFGLFRQHVSDAESGACTLFGSQ